MELVDDEAKCRPNRLYCLFVCFSSSGGSSSELTLLVDKLQRNADKVQKNIYDIEQNLNKVQSHNRHPSGFQDHFITLISIDPFIQSM